MVTIVTQLPFAYPGSTGLPSLDVTQAEIDIVRRSELRAWWRADVGFSSEGWRDRKGDILLSPRGSALPTLGTDAAFNSHARLRFGTGTNNGLLYDAGQNLIPMSADYTFVVVFRAATDDAAFVVADNAATSAAFNIGQRATTTPDSLQWQHNGATVLASVGTPSNSVANVVLASYDYSEGDAYLRMNGAAVASNLAVTNQVTNASLHVGGCGNAGGTLSGGLDAGDVAEILLFTVPLAHADYATLRADVEAYLLDRYGL